MPTADRFLLLESIQRGALGSRAPALAGFLVSFQMAANSWEGVVALSDLGPHGPGVAAWDCRCCDVENLNSPGLAPSEKFFARDALFPGERP